MGVLCLTLVGIGNKPYKTRVFEFIATSHTPKNILIVGVKLRELVAPDQEVMAKIQEIMRMFGITYHEL